MTTGSVASTGKGQEVAESPRKVRGVVSVDIERCKGCGFCVEFCPSHVLVMSAKFNGKGYHYPELVAGKDCLACDLCGMYCPDFAIYASRDPSSVSTKE
jgi:2-oxoglutarate ferredoxin oxidoreductase subunit delta